MENEKYMVAASYKDYERIASPYVKNGKMYTKVKEICSRCNGRGIIISRVENGQLIPIPVDSGVCYKCLGKKYFVKEVRLYTEAEAAKMEAANERARVKREAERRAKMEAEYEQKKAEWLKKNEWTPDGKTYVVAGDSYSIKDELKECGFRYDPILRWHKANPGKYSDRVVEVKLDDVIEMSAWGEGHYLTSAQEFVNNLIDPKAEDETPSEWVGTIGDKYIDTVTLVRKGWCDTRFGGSNIYTFKDADGNKIVWFTSTRLAKEVGDTFKMRATVKAHNEYKGKKNTVVTRAKVVED